MDDGVHAVLMYVRSSCATTVTVMGWFRPHGSCSNTGSV